MGVFEQWVQRLLLLNVVYTVEVRDDGNSAGCFRQRTTEIPPVSDRISSHNRRNSRRSCPTEITSFFRQFQPTVTERDGGLNLGFLPSMRL